MGYSSEVRHGWHAVALTSFSRGDGGHDGGAAGQPVLPSIPEGGCLDQVDHNLQAGAPALTVTFLLWKVSPLGFSPLGYRT